MIQHGIFEVGKRTSQGGVDHGLVYGSGSAGRREIPQPGNRRGCSQMTPDKIKNRRDGGRAEPCGKNPTFCPVQHLGGVRGKRFPAADLRVMTSVSAILSKQSVMRKWTTISDPIPAEVKPEPLFIHSDGSPMPILHTPDPDFLRHGLLRGPIELRGMSQSPDPSRVSNLLCCLRALFGVNVRAEIIAWLLTHESGHPAAIARDTGYFSKSVQHTLNEMEDSGHIRSRRDGREKIFWVKPGAWDFLISWSQPLGFPRWVDWMPVFSAITTILGPSLIAGGLKTGMIVNPQANTRFDTPPSPWPPPPRSNPFSKATATVTMSDSTPPPYRLPPLRRAKATKSSPWKSGAWSKKPVEMRQAPKQTRRSRMNPLTPC